MAILVLDRRRETRRKWLIGRLRLFFCHAKRSGDVQRKRTRKGKKQFLDAFDTECREESAWRQIRDSGLRLHSITHRLSAGNTRDKTFQTATVRIVDFDQTAIGRWATIVGDLRKDKCF